MLTARFFRFRGLLPGVVGRLASEDMVDGCKLDSLSEVFAREWFAGNDEGKGLDMGDSGDDPGDISVALESSTVDTVVVGEEFAEPDADVDILSLWW